MDELKEDLALANKLMKGKEIEVPLVVKDEDTGGYRCIVATLKNGKVTKAIVSKADVWAFACGQLKYETAVRILHNQAAL